MFHYFILVNFEGYWWHRHGEISLRRWDFISKYGEGLWSPNAGNENCYRFILRKTIKPRDFRCYIQQLFYVYWENLKKVRRLLIKQENTCDTRYLSKQWKYGALFRKKINNFFENIFLWSIILFLSTWNTFFMQLIVDMKHFFVQHQLVFADTRLIFVALCNINFWHKIVFRAKSKFSFGHCLECCHCDIF